MLYYTYIYINIICYILYVIYYILYIIYTYILYIYYTYIIYTYIILYFRLYIHILYYILLYIYISKCWNQKKNRGSGFVNIANQRLQRRNFTSRKCGQIIPVRVPNHSTPKQIHTCWWLDRRSTESDPSACAWPAERSGLAPHAELSYIPIKYDGRLSCQKIPESMTGTSINEHEIFPCISING